MSLTFTLDDFKSYQPDTSLSEDAGFQALINNTNFRSSPEHMAILGCGGTISSAYYPSRENIGSTSRNPVFDVTVELNRSFGIANSNISYLSLLQKDSRDITVRDIEFVLNVLHAIQNRKIVLTCGTYGLPVITQIIGAHLKAPGKIVGVTGSMLPSSFREHDVEFNGGGVISAVNTLARFRKEIDEPVVFANFHGRIFTPEDCQSLNLHPESHAQIEFYRSQPLVKP